MAQTGWDKQFKKSLEQSGSEESGDRQYLTRPITAGFEPLSDSEDSQLFALAHNALAHQYFEKSLRHLEYLVHPCESPIEKAMLYALCILAHEYASHVRYKVTDYEFGDHERAAENICIEPQATLGQYRVDFLVTYEELCPNFDNPVKLSSGDEIPGSKWLRQQLIIECDGHDFHEKTKDQAKRDRQRDRELQKLGFLVFRYTGSEIWADVFHCAEEALKALKEKVVW